MVYVQKTETSPSIKCKYFAIKWYSFIIIKTLTTAELQQYRRTEKLLNKCIKLEKDIQFNITCEENNLLPNYTKISKKNQHKEHHKLAEKFQSSLVGLEIKNLQTKLISIRKELTVNLIYIYKIDQYIDYYFTIFYFIK